MSLKRLLLTLLLLATVGPYAGAADKLKEAVIRVGETVYARFEVDGRKIKLVAVSKETDAQAQVIFSLSKDEAKKTVKLRVENKFPKDLVYRAEIRSHKYGLHAPASLSPVVGGKLAFETLPELVEELAAFDFKLQK